MLNNRSFTWTAKRRGVTQSAVSQMVASVERTLGVSLAQRDAGDVRPTPAGDACMPYLDEIARLEDELTARMEEMRAKAAGVIKLAACYSIGLHQLPPVLKQFAAASPHIDVRVRQGLIDWAHQEVLAGDADLGLVCYPRRLPGLVVDTFRHERLMLVCHPDHPLAARPEIKIGELKGCRFVAWQEIKWSPFLKKVPNCQRHLFTPHQEFHEVEMVKSVVEMDGGIAILPEAVVLSEVAGRRLAAVPFADDGCTEPLAVIYRKKKRLTPAMREFIAALKQPAPAGN